MKTKKVLVADLRTMSPCPVYYLIIKPASLWEPEVSLLGETVGGWCHRDSGIISDIRSELQSNSHLMATLRTHYLDTTLQRMKLM